MHVAPHAPIGMPRKAGCPEATKLAFTISKELLLTINGTPLHACYLIAYHKFLCCVVHGDLLDNKDVEHKRALSMQYTSQLR